MGRGQADACQGGTVMFRERRVLEIETHDGIGKQ